MANTPEPTQPGPAPGNIRIVAGDGGRPSRRRALQIGVAAGLVVLVGGGAAVASVVAKNNEAQPA
ncbi:MAG TPA: sulfonate ABC transporter substrate-binding protein, partial [Arthrobacter sp.]|nr:sulfonate ABC transporter substrate-binding protein [Arthrobacter sp.]